jgi:DNA-binding transcriptional regulator LsrR (DeoR family)
MESTNTTDPSLTAAVLSLYYLRRETQKFIASELHVGLSTVNRILSDARLHGLVEHSLKLPSEDALAGELRMLFHPAVPKPRVIVLPLEKVRSRELRLSAIGSAGAVVLERILRPGMSLAIDGGETVAKVIEQMQRVVKNLKLFPVAGGPLLDPLTSLPTLIGRFLGKYGTNQNLRAHLFPEPVEDVATILTAEPKLGAVLMQAAASDIFLMGVGSVSVRKSSETADQLLKRFNTPKTEVLERGAIGIMGYSMFDKEGSSVRSVFDRRVLKIAPEDLQKAARSQRRHVIVVAHGNEKAAALRTVISRGWVNMTITDCETARAILAVKP